MTARYVVRVSPADVGRRVSVRSRLPPQEPGPPAAPGPTMTDTVGHLRSWRDGVLEIERPDGSLRRIAESDLVAGRVIPPAPPRR
ncbi:MAG: GNAT family N-acetyltransferase, partial [Nitriliruptorales bacterium]|nr:GNAT family N-acetyltransferase [Nitriliruptorales bacterium]